MFYQNTMDHVASDLSAELRKLKHAYETLSSKKDNEVSALLSEKDSASNQLSIMQQDYANKKVQVAQAIEAALKLQQSVDELKVLAQKKDDEICRLQADAVEARRNLQKIDSLVKEKDDEIQRLKDRHPVPVQKCIKDISEPHKNFRSDDPGIRSKSKNSDLMKMVEDYISQTGMVGKDWQDEPRQKRRRISFISNVSIPFPIICLAHGEPCFLCLLEDTPHVAARICGNRCYMIKLQEARRIALVNV